MEQIKILKNSLGIPVDLEDAETDALLQSYLDMANSYALNIIDQDYLGAAVDQPIFNTVIIELATYYYQNRGDSSTPIKGLPYTLQVLLNSLKYQTQRPYY